MVSILTKGVLFERPEDLCCEHDQKLALLNNLWRELRGKEFKIYGPIEEKRLWSKLGSEMEIVCKMLVK